MIGLAVMLFLLNICLCMNACLAATFKHQDVIQENGTRFVQRTEIHTNEKVEIFHVPAHNGLLELKELYDFKSGLVLRCLPARRKCYLAKFDRKNYDRPTTLERNLRRFERKYRSPRREEKKETVIKENLVVVDSNPVDIANLTPRMRKMLGNYKLYREDHLPTGAKILKDDGSPMVKPKRTKRGSYSCSHGYRLCRYNRAPIWAYMPTRTSTRSCERTYHCTYYSCHWKHLTHNNFYRCCCCQEHKTSQECYRVWGQCSYAYYG